MRGSVIFSLALLSFSSFVLAADAIQVDVSKTGFSQQHNAVIAAINSDANYSEISMQDRSAVNEALTRISAKLGDGSAFANLDDTDRKQVEGDQRFINEALLKAVKDSRLVCTREPVLGSNFAKKVCRTAATLKRENDKVRDDGTNGKPKI